MFDSVLKHEGFFRFSTLIVLREDRDSHYAPWMLFPKNKTPPPPTFFISLRRKEENLRIQPPVSHVYPTEVWSNLSLSSSLHPPRLSPTQTKKPTSFSYMKITTLKDLLKLPSFKAEYVCTLWPCNFLLWHRSMSTFVYQMTRIRIS